MNCSPSVRRRHGRISAHALWWNDVQRVDGLKICNEEGSNDYGKSEVQVLLQRNATQRVFAPLEV